MALNVVATLFMTSSPTFSRMISGITTTFSSSASSPSLPPTLSFSLSLFIFFSLLRLTMYTQAQVHTAAPMTK